MSLPLAAFRLLLTGGGQARQFQTAVYGRRWICRHAAAGTRRRSHGPGRAAVSVHLTPPVEALLPQPILAPKLGFVSKEKFIISLTGIGTRCI
jgi:hypothetical protein